MKHRLWSTATLTGATLVLSLASPVFAGEGGPLTPELAAKREMVRKQEAQRITPDKKKAAAEALKAERLKVHQAKEAAKNLNPNPNAEPESK